VLRGAPLPRRIAKVRADVSVSSHPGCVLILPEPFSSDWTPAIITNVRYSCTVRHDLPLSTARHPICGVRCLAGVSLFLLGNVADGFFLLDQFAGQEAWHLSGLGHPVLTLAFWQWTILSCVTLILVKFAEKIAGIKTRFLVTCFALVLGGLARGLIHFG
jgi:hypothetical protein